VKKLPQNSTCHIVEAENIDIVDIHTGNKQMKIAIICLQLAEHRRTLLHNVLCLNEM